MPADDRFKFQTTQEKIDWTSVAVEGRSGSECEAQWKGVLKSLRTFKTFSDLLREAQNAIESREAAEDASSFSDELCLEFFAIKRKEYKRSKATDASGTRLSRIYADLISVFPDMTATQKAKLHLDHRTELAKFVASKGLDGETKSKPTTVAETLKPPNKPLNPFQHFTVYARQRIEAKLKSKGNSKTEILNIVRQKWNALDDDGKTYFVKNAVEGVIAYEEEVKKYKKKFPDADVEETHDVLNKSEKAIYGLTLGVPTRPVTTGFMLYTQEHLSSGKLNGIELTGRMSKIAQLWGQLTDDEKKLYAVKAASALEHYKACLAKADPERLRFIGVKKTSAGSTKAKPQKPFDALRAYIESKTASYQLKHPDASPTEVNKKLTSKFNKLDDKKKEKYKTKALKMKAKHEAAETQSAEPAQPKEVKLTKKQKKEALGPRPSCPNAYSLFSQECMKNQEMMKGIPQKERFTVVSQKWKALSATEREKYEVEFKMVIEQFVKEHPDSDYAVRYKKRQTQEAEKASKKSNADGARKNVVTSTPKPKSPVKEDDDDSDDEDDAVPEAPDVSQIPSKIVPAVDNEEDDEDDDEEENDDDDDKSSDEEELPKYSPSKSIGKTLSSPTKSPAKAKLASILESSSEEEDSEDDDDEE